MNAEETISGKEKLWNGILEMAQQMGFAACGCARAVPLSGSLEEQQYMQAHEKGHFGRMEYLRRNIDKRMDPALLLPGAKSVIVFLAPFSGGGPCISSDGLRISEYALGEDYHKVIKDKLFRIASFIEDSIKTKKSCRVFTDSAPVMERAWAVRAGLGFIGKNNFLISPQAGIKNFIGTVITVAELPYADKTVPNGCGQCSRCLDACTGKALYSPYSINASKCMSYKTIEAPLEDADNERTTYDPPVSYSYKWIFGCDDCMNACPWNRFNKPGWKEFSVNCKVLEGFSAKGWMDMTEEDFNKKFGNSPLLRAGLKKIRQNILR